jgi:hypothetical protein
MRVSIYLTRILRKVLAVVWAASVVFAASADHEMVEMDFKTTVQKQLNRPGILDALRQAKSVSVQMINYAKDPRGSVIDERAIRANSKAVKLTPDQRASLLAMLSDDVEYQETLATCDCHFDPQMRVSFDASTPLQHYDILLSGMSHGEIGAYVNAKPTAYARTWTFIPRYLDLIASVFPDCAELPRLRELHKERLQMMANQATPAAAL